MNFRLRLGRWLAWHVVLQAYRLCDWIAGADSLAEADE